MTEPLLKSYLIFVLIALAVFNASESHGQQDCFDAIKVCDQSFTQANAYAGTGAVSEIPSGSSCLGNGESNSVWYVFTIISAGDLTFQLTPNVATDDYDFAVYDLTTDSCAGIVNGTNTPVSCNYSATTGATGLSNGATQTTAGSSDPNQNAPLSVSVGQTFALMVSNFTSSQSGYQLDFAGTASIVDQNPPSVESIDLGGQCSPTQVFLELNEPIACNTVQFSGGDFSISGPQAVSIQTATAINCNSEGFSTTVRLTFDVPLGTAGSYSIIATAGVGGSTVEDFCGNQISPGPLISFPVVEPGPVISFANLVNTQCGASNGGATIDITGGAAPYNISWSTGSNQNQTTHNSLGPGTYFVTVGDQNGCTANESFEIINSNPLLITPQNVVGVTCNSSTDGSAEVTIGSGSGDYTITWNTTPEQYGISASSLSGGNVLVTVLDNVSGCEVSQNVSIPQPSSIAIPITSVQPGCGASDGEATANPSGGNGNFSYSWNTTPPQNTPTATGLPAGVYQVTVTDDQGCSESNTVVLTDDNPPAANLVSSLPDCNGQGTGQATALATSGASPFTYAWSTVPPQVGATATGLVEGDYYVTITDATGCVQIINVKIDTVETPIINETITQPSCGMSDGEIEVDVTHGIQPLSYSWSPSMNTSNIESGLADGSYMVTVTDSIGCTVAETFELTQLPPVSEIEVNSVCFGEEMSFSFTTTSGATAWEWDFGDGTTSTDANPTHTFSTYGDFDVSLSLTGGCLPDDLTQTATVFEPPTAAFITDPEIPTTRDEVAFVYTGNGGNSFTWDLGDGTSFTDSRPVHQYPEAGTYDVFLGVVDANGCEDTLTQTIEVLQEPVVYLPNAFIPEGTLENSRFRGYGIGVVSAELSVFDRWGTMVYYSNDIGEILTSGWDGTFKGKPAKQGAYAYKLKSSFYDGNEFQKLGTVTLIR